MDPDGTAMTSEIAREELGDYLGKAQLVAVTLTREQFNQGVRVHNAEVIAAGRLSQIMEPVLPVNTDKDGNRREKVEVYTIASDESSLSPPPTTSYGGSDVSFPSQTPRERVLSSLPSTNYSGGSILGLPLSADPENPFSVPRASAGLILQRYIESETNGSQHAEKEGGIEETRRVDTPIPRKFEISDNSDDPMTEVQWREDEPYLTPTKKGKKRNKGKGVKRPVTPERPIPNMPQTPSRRKLESDWAKPADMLTSEDELADLGKFIGEYLQNTNGLRDFMVGQERNDASYDLWCRISKMYFSHWKTPGVSERMWSVILDASISGEYQTLAEYSCRPSE